MTIKQAIKAVKARMAALEKERDRLRDLTADINEVESDVSMAVDDLEHAIDLLSQHV